MAVGIGEVFLMREKEDWGKGLPGIEENLPKRRLRGEGENCLLSLQLLAGLMLVWFRCEVTQRSTRQRLVCQSLVLLLMQWNLKEIDPGGKKLEQMEMCS